MFSLTTSFDREDFTRLLVEQFQVPVEQVHGFFDTVRGMNFYDDQTMTVRQLFDRYFPGREDVIRLLMEPITYANGCVKDIFEGFSAVRTAMQKTFLKAF